MGNSEEKLDKKSIDEKPLKLNKEIWEKNWKIVLLIKNFLILT